MENIQKQSFGKIIFLGGIWALAMSLVLILIFAFCLRFFGIGESAIITIVQIIKGISILFGVFLAMKKANSMGFISGLTIGFVFTIVSFLVFSMLDGFNFDFSNTFLNDIIFGSIIGGICGIIAVNLKK